MWRKKFVKRKYEKRVLSQALKHKDFLIKHLQYEWDLLEKEASKEKLLRVIKEGGTTAAIVAGKTLLTLLIIGGVVTVATIAPNILGAIGRLGKRKVYFHQRHFRKEIHYLTKRNYIRIKNHRNIENDDQWEIKLTELGMKRAVMSALGEFRIHPHKHWDRIWRIVIFDIPNKHKWARDGLRHRLKTIGFYQLQESVFVFPYSCEDELGFLAFIYNVHDYMRIIETGKIIHDDDLRKYFDLK